MPRGPTKGRAPVERVEVRIPLGVYADFDQLVAVEKRWKSVADFLLEAGKREVERWKQEHPGTPASAEAVSAFGRRT